MKTNNHPQSGAPAAGPDNPARQPHPEEAAQSDAATPAQPSLETLPAEQAMALLGQDPVGFIQQVVAQAADMHLTRLKEEAELRGVIHAFRKANPEFEQFEPFIMQEAAQLIQNDPDGVIDPWDKLLEKALSNFKAKFQEAIKEGLVTLEKPETPEPPFVESANHRVMPKEPPSFSREKIAKMSLAEFLKHEEAINQALKENRIR